MLHIPHQGVQHHPYREKSYCNGFERVNKQAKTFYLLICVAQTIVIFSCADVSKGRNDPRIIELASPEFIPYDPNIIFSGIEQQCEICDLVLR